MKTSRHKTRRPVDSRGAALLVSIMVTVVLTLLGLTYLFQADLENQIARAERDRVQLLPVAEAGVRMVRHWFDNPIRDDISAPSHLFLNTYDIRKKKHYDFDQRLLDHDGNPATAPLVSGDTDWVYYMQGYIAPGSPVSDGDTNHALTVFQKPYRGSYEEALMGTEAGPDIVISDSSSSDDVKEFLAGINAALFSDVRASGRITKIEVYQPPRVNLGGIWERYGIATVKVTASKFRPTADGGERAVATRVVEAVLNEAPFAAVGPFGLLHSCQGMEIGGSFEGHWGLITAMEDIVIKTGGSLDTKWDSSVPYASPTSYISNLGLPLEAGPTYNQDMSGTVLEDPWLNLRALGFIVDADNTDPQAWPTAYVAGGDPKYDASADHSNLFQQDPSVSCPSFPYELWKRVAQSGGRDVHYLTWVADDLFKAGTIVKTFHDWTHLETGLFFFDTRDARRPDGTNLTPAIKIRAAWHVRGFIYLNAQNFRSTGASGRDVALIPPGEPYQDIYQGGPGYTSTYNAEPFSDDNNNGVWDPTESFTDTIPAANGGTDDVYDAEPFLSLDYGTVMGPGNTPPEMTVQEMPDIETVSVVVDGVTITRTTTNGRDASGLPVVADVNLYGVLYTSGHFSAQGNATYYGSIVAKSGVGEAFFGGSTANGTPNFYYDERLASGDWPPFELSLPLTIITAWNPDL